MRLASSAALVPLLLAACSSSSVAGSSSGGSSSGGAPGDASSDGGSSSRPCNQDPWECPSSQTCWPQSQSAFACFNAGPGALGAACQNTVGEPTCGAGLFCLQGSTMGTCLAYCSTTDPKHACSGGSLCEAVVLGGVSGPAVFVCVPGATGGDGGTTGG